MPSKSDDEASARQQAEHSAGRAFAGSQSSRSVHFADAEAFIVSSLGDDLTDDPSQSAYLSRWKLETDCLSKWAEDLNLWVPDKVLAQRGKGRREHDLILIEDPETGSVQRVMKLTKGQRSGFLPVCDRSLVSSTVSDWFQFAPATPLQYLRRMRLTHDLFPGLDHRLEGFAILESTFRVVISQRFVYPESANEKEVVAYFEGMGFVRVLQDSWYQAASNLAIFDAGRSNILAHEGFIFPVDVNPIRPGTFMKARIHEALQRPWWSR